MKTPSTARTAGRSDRAERRFRRQPFILLLFRRTGILLKFAQNRLEIPLCDKDATLPRRSLHIGSQVQTRGVSALCEVDRGMIQQAGGNGCARLQRASASSGVAAPQGCVIFFASAEIEICTSCAQGLSACARQGRYHYHRCAPRAAETLDGRLSKRLTCRFLRLPSSTPCAVTFSANTQISLSAISVANAFSLWYDKSQIRIFRR